MGPLYGTVVDGRSIFVGRVRFLNDPGLRRGLSVGPTEFSADVRRFQSIWLGRGPNGVSGPRSERAERRGISTVPKEKADCREWVVSTVKGTKLPSLKPWRPVKSLKLISRQGAVKNAERQLTKPLRARPPWTSASRRAHHPRCRVPPPAPVDDSDERRDAAMRWLERRRRSRGETLVAVTEEDDLNNSLTIYVLDDVAKAWIVVGCTSIARELHNVCACDGAVLLDSLVGAEVFDLDRWAGGRVPLKYRKRTRSF